LRQVIDGRVYDTDTATEIATASYSNPTDFHHYKETLYKTARGRFFLSGGGGPMSRWARSTGPNETSGSTGILAFSDEDALEWCERHEVDADTISEHFDNLIEEA
jgi:hypothetical protein